MHPAIRNHFGVELFGAGVATRNRDIGMERREVGNLLAECPFKPVKRTIFDS
jgi:hypothetical protein